MKRAGHLYEQLYSTEICQKAYAGVMKGKHRKYDPTSIAFMIRNNTDYYIRETGRILYERSFKPSKPHEFSRYDKGSHKLREIQAPRIFPDQFVHWAIVLVLLPYLEKGMDDYCCASVKGRGTSYAKELLEKALDDTKTNSKKNPHKLYKYVLKMDVKKFFKHINRLIMMNKLERLTKDKEFLELCRKVIFSVPGTGLPLGFYTSQWFANYYLQSFDHYLREVLMPKYGVHFYIRYMDDMIILGSNKRKLNKLKEEINEYLKSELDLELKSSSGVFKISDETPIDFLGYKFSYGKTTLRRRIIKHMLDANGDLYKGKFTIKKLSVNNAYHGWRESSSVRGFEESELQGNIALERYKYKMLMNKKLSEEANNKTAKHVAKITKDIYDLKLKESGDDSVLVRYNQNTDQVRIVARSTFVFPDKEEYEAKIAAEKEARELEKLERKKNKAKKKRKKGKYNYYPTAEIFVNSDKDPKLIAKAYNDEIRLAEELVSYT